MTEKVGKKYVVLSQSKVYPSVDWEKEKEVTGKISEHRTVSLVIGDRDLVIIERETDGSKVSVWLSTQLKGLKYLPVGTDVRIRYEGMKKSSNSGRTYRSFTIEFDPSSVKEPF